MIGFFKRALICAAIAIFIGSVCWLVIKNPLEYTLKDVRELSKQIIIYTFTAAVAIFGYWWTQREQNKRHDAEIMEGRKNKTLDLQLDALWQQTLKRQSFNKLISNSTDTDLYQFVEDDRCRERALNAMHDALNDQTTHAMFYLNSDEYEIVDILFEMKQTVDDLYSYTFQALPIPKELDSYPMMISIEEVLQAYLMKLHNLSHLLDWEIGRIIEGKIIARYDFGYASDEQDQRFDEPEEYARWKDEEYRAIRLNFGLTNTELYFNGEPFR